MKTQLVRESSAAVDMRAAEPHAFAMRAMHAICAALRTAAKQRQFAGLFAAEVL
jgi:hypothetical protein